MSKQFMAILAAVVVGLGVIFWVSGNKSDTNNQSSNSSAKPTSHIEGKGKKNITLVEYGDYQCPVCGGFYPVVKQVVAQYSEDIRFQFRNLPLTQLHPNAFAAARAAEAAGLQNQYFQMHDLLFQNQTGWSEVSNPLATFQAYAQQLKLDMTKFNTDYASSAVNDAIQADVAEFAKTGQSQGTPAFFLDGKYIPNTDVMDEGNRPSLPKFSALIKAAIDAKD